MPTYTITQFKTRTGEILDSLNDGEEVIITRRGKPCAKLTAVPKPAESGEKKHSGKSLMGAYRGILPDATWEDFQEAKRIWRVRTSFA